MKRTLGQLVNVVIILGCIGVLIIACFPLFNLHFNTSDSLPRGIYRQISTGAEGLKRGDIVRFCLSGEAARITKSRGYVDTPFLNTGCEEYLRPLMKPVAALPGDYVEVSRDGVRINGQMLANSKSITEDGLHRPMPIADSGTVEDGTVWLLSTHHLYSWDSRYYGAVPLANVRGIVRPFIIWSNP